jgi:O-antigen/teichoic acid export membrane protein
LPSGSGLVVFKIPPVSLLGTLTVLHKFTEKYRNQPGPLKAAFWFTVCNVITKGVNFFTVPVYVRLLTTEQYGMYSIYNSWLGILSIFATLNLSAGIFNRGMVKYEADRNGYIAAMQGLGSLVTLIWFAIYCVFRGRFNALFNLPALLPPLIFIQCFFSPALGFWSVRQRFEYKYRPFFIVAVLMALVTPALGIIFIRHSQHQGEAFILGTVLAQLLFFLFFYIYNFITGKTFFNKAYWRFALGFNIPLIPHYLSGIVLGQADRVMIDRLVGRDEAGVYSLAYAFALAINVVVNGVNASFTPWMFQALKAKRHGSIGKTANVPTLFFAIVVLLFIAAAPEMIRIIAPPEYYDAIWVIPPVVLSVYFTFLYNLFGNIEFYFEKTLFVMTASIIAAISNILLNFLFIPPYGYVAAGYTTFVCYGFFALAHYFFMKRICREKLEGARVFDTRFILLTTTGLVVAAFVFAALYRAPLVRYGVFAVCLIGCFAKRKIILNMVSTFYRK